MPLSTIELYYSDLITYTFKSVSQNSFKISVNCQCSLNETPFFNNGLLITALHTIPHFSAFYIYNLIIHLNSFSSASLKK